jgi:homopolymeric O-antigen transport system permease protein
VSTVAEVSNPTITGGTCEPSARAEREPASGELPVTVIERRSGWGFVDLTEIWRFRELLFFLIWRDVKVRYKQTVLGAAWAILQPLATMLVFTLFLGQMAGLAATDMPYSLFVLAGILPWTLFANGITSAGQSVVSSQNLVTKIYFPRALIPLGAIGAGIVDFAVALGLLFLLMVWFGVAPGFAVLSLPLLVFGVIMAAMGVGMLLAALTVAYRDFRHIVPFLVQLWMFATPCIYLDAGTVLGPTTQTLLPLNPIYGFVLNFRAAILGLELDAYSLAVSGAISVALLLLGSLYFRRVERGFADII